MEQRENDIKLGRFLCLILRHHPEEAGITLDEHGWADVRALLRGVCATGREIDMETLERIVREDNKQRYSFNEDHTKIRANQGHSIPAASVPVPRDCRPVPSRYQDRWHQKDEPAVCPPFARLSDCGCGRPPPR